MFLYFEGKGCMDGRGCLFILSSCLTREGEGYSLLALAARATIDSARLGTYAL